MLLLVCTIKITFLNQLSSPEKPINLLILLICRNFYPFFWEMVNFYYSIVIIKRHAIALFVKTIFSFRINDINQKKLNAH
jgi:hypothetical protein